MTEKELEKASVAIKEMTIDTVTIMALPRCMMNLVSGRPGQTDL